MRKQQAEIRRRLPPAIIARHHILRERVVESGAHSNRADATAHQHPVALQNILAAGEFGMDLGGRLGTLAAQRVDATMLAVAEIAAIGGKQCQRKRIIAPLARALRPGGRLIGIHSHGQDPGLEIIQAVWPGENPFSVSRHELLRAVKYELGSAGRDLNFNAYADNRSIFRYDMEALPNEVTGSIGSIPATYTIPAWTTAWL